MHHASNSSGVAEGWAAVLLASPNYAKAYGLKPHARVVAMANMGDSPTLMMNAPAPAARKIRRTDFISSSNSLPSSKGESNHCCKDCGQLPGNVIQFTREKLGMRLLHSLVLALAFLASSSAIAQTAYPDRPIKMIVPLAAASAVDVAARIVTQKMADNMGQQFVILNQPGYQAFSYSVT